MRKLRMWAAVAMLVVGQGPARADETIGMRAAPATSSAPELQAPVDAPFGLYPLWEHTAATLPSGSFHVGYGHAAVALGPVQLGTQPFLDVYGTANLDVKLRLWRTERTRGALILGAYRVPTRAEARTLGNLDAAGFTNPYGPVWIVPLTFARSVTWSPRLALHWASTLLFIGGERDAQRSLAGGQTLMLETRASVTSPWTARFHGGVEGIGVEAQAHAGLSFGYVGKTVRLAAGVARRFVFGGEASTVLMLDGGLLFP